MSLVDSASSLIIVLCLCVFGTLLQSGQAKCGIVYLVSMQLIIVNFSDLIHPYLLQFSIKV